MTGVAIATYSTIDAAGVRLVAPWLYGWVLWILIAVALTIFTRWSHTHGEPVPIEAPTWQRSGVMGGIMLLAYVCVLFALRLAPLSVVAPLRESAIVLAPLWGAWRLGERAGLAIRLAGAGVIALGAATPHRWGVEPRTCPIPYTRWWHGSGTAVQADLARQSTSTNSSRTSRT